MLVKNFLKTSKVIIALIAVTIVSLESLIGIYDNKDRVLYKVKKTYYEFMPDYFQPLAKPLNNVSNSNRQLPPVDLKDLSVNDDAHLIGQWSSPFDWNMQSVHAILLPDQSIMTYGTYGLDKKEDTNIKFNKKITMTDGRTIQRDFGHSQWLHHDVNVGADFNIWDYQKGVKENSQTLFKKPVAMDAFCSIARIIDQDNVFILGGGHSQHDNNIPDTQNGSMIYSIKNRSFRKFKNLLRKRWYGSAVITGDRKLFLFGGKDVNNEKIATTPEMIDLNKPEDGFKLIKEADSNQMFGNEDADEWNYPRAFLTSDGNIVGISYNKLWVMDAKNNYRIQKTGEIPLETGSYKEVINKENPWTNEMENFKFFTIGAPVGSTNNILMHELDKVLVFGGRQLGEGYSSSNKVYEIDFSDSFNPKIKKLQSTIHPRSNANSTMLPDGRIFINGGHFSEENETGILKAEIYDPKLEESIPAGEAQFNRNYHSTSILLPDGRVLTTGGDVFNSEIYYPPYLFKKNSNDMTILATRPEIFIPNKTVITRGSLVKTKFSGSINKLHLISTGSTTHAQSSESKLRNISFKKHDDNILEFIIDINPNNLQDGYYLLFGLDEEGVPSIGKFVYIN